MQQHLADTLNTFSGIQVPDMENGVVDEVNHGLLSMGADSIWADRLDNIIVLALIILVALAANVICHKVVLQAVAKLVKRTKATWDDIIFDHKVMVHLSRMVAPVLIYMAIPLAFPGHEDSMALDILRKLCLVYITISGMLFANVFLSAVYHVYSQLEQYRDKPLKGLLQTLQVGLAFIAIILVVSIFIGKSPGKLLAGLGASAAVLMLVFKDSIMGVVSGIQLTANHMLKVGDWISIPKHGADGIVKEVTLNTVKVRNWDNSVTTVPPYMLVSDSFQNWQAMHESGGRRIKRAVNIDMTSVKFCTREMMHHYRGIDLLRPWVDEMEEQMAQYNTGHGIDDPDSVNALRPTNLGAFRAYLTAYIKSLPVTNRELFCFVRHLQPTEKGIPVELWFYSTVKTFAEYEAIQANVFDHVLAIVPEFGLRIYQLPSGNDLSCHLPSAGGE